MLRVLVISGPNLDRLGEREPHIYGTDTLDAIHRQLSAVARSEGASVVARQTPHEGEIVAWIGAAKKDGFVGILINPGALSHTSIAILDALSGAGVPAVEVHLSNPEAREAFRRRSYAARACVGKVAGFGPRSYELGLLGLLGALRSRDASKSREALGRSSPKRARPARRVAAKQTR